MKKITLMILAAVSILFTNCKTKSKATTTSDSSSTAAKDVKIQCRVAVSFISFASGIDAAAYDKIEAFIKNHAKKPAFDVIPMGREGERDICMSLKEMNKDEQKAFIAELNNLAKTSDRVKVNENQERTKQP
ncbi:MAG: hypothetical protein KA163_06910 [Bacteroidia bacterium]|nr:hypothetical protein [Bacteroidia bacterium]